MHLFEQPERDQFRTESPIRAFTDWNVSGHYAIGKGFRPSVQHLPQYLDAMRRKENWNLLQILEPTSGAPSFVFERMASLSPPFLNTEAMESIKAVHARTYDAGEFITNLQADRDSREQNDTIFPTPSTEPVALAAFFPDEIDPDAEIAFSSPIPEGVYAHDGNFYDQVSRKGQGNDFYAKWRHRITEFPTKALDWRENNRVPIPDEHWCDCAEFVIRELRKGAYPKYIEAAVRDFRKRFDPIENKRKGITQKTHTDLVSQIGFVVGSTYEEIRDRIDAYRLINAEALRGSVTATLDDVNPDHLAAAFPPRADDPVNPAHYNGTACAEIIEHLPGNLAHAMTYIWRAGDKPNQPEVQELEKAIWFLEREHRLADALVEEEDLGLSSWTVTSAPSKRGRRDANKNPFWQYAVRDRINKTFTVNGPAWKPTVLTAIILYAIERKASVVTNVLKQLRARRCELLGEDCPEFGRQQEP